MAAQPSHLQDRLGKGSLDADGLLLREGEKRTGIVEQFAAGFQDHRQAERIEQEV